jgi:hypothetical protein
MTCYNQQQTAIPVFFIIMSYGKDINNQNTYSYAFIEEVF